MPLFLASLLCTLLALTGILLLNLGIDWLTLGDGLHPLVAFPLAVLCLLAALMIPLAVLPLNQHRR